VSKSSLEDPHRSQAFDQELSICQSLRHPNIVEFIDHLEDRLNHYIVMEVCVNGSLYSHITTRTKLPESAAISFMNQIFSALQYCHRLGFVHRDIKPENILLDSADHAKLSDFGLGRSTDGLLSTHCGSLCYTAPEVCAGQKYLGPPADIWSCGVLLYVMVTGTIPWSAPNVPAMRLQIQRADYRQPWQVSRACQDLLQRMLTPDPSARITIPEVRAHAWMTSGGDTRRAASLTQMILTRPTLENRTMKSLTSFPTLAESDEAVVAEARRLSGGGLSGRITVGRRRSVTRPALPPLLPVLPS
jgi:serine/threonine protein kinase